MITTPLLKRLLADMRISLIQTITLGIQLIACMSMMSKSVWAQSNNNTVSLSNNVAKLQQIYPNAKAVFTLKKRSVTISLGKKDSIKILTENRFEMLHIRNKSEQFATESVPFSKFNQILNIDAYTQVQENGKTKKIKVQEKDYITSSVLSRNWFYDDYKERSFLFPAIEPGALTVLNYKEIIKEPRFLGVFYLNSYVPVQKSEYTLVVNKNIKIAYKLFGTQNIKVNFTKKKIDDKVIYSWQASQLPEYNTAKDAPSLSYYEPHIVVYITEVNGKQMLASPSSLYDWYYSLTKDVNKKLLKEIQTLVDTLIKDKSSEKEKAKTIFHWVQNNIKYIAIEDGLSGFVPRSASEVFNNRHGDCKDMSSLIVTMLKMAEIPAYLTWVGTRKLPYSYFDVPTPMVDNHMIATAKIDGKNVFMDATDNYLPFEMPTAMIQGKEALIGLDSAKYEITTIPIIESEANKMLDSCVLVIDKEDIKAKGQMRLTGYYKSNTGLDILEKRTEEQKSHLIQLLGNEYLHPELHQFSYHLAESDDQQLGINYTFGVGKHCKVAKNEIFINLHLDRKWQNEIIDVVKRKIDREIEYKFNEIRCYVVNIPEDYNITFIPPNSSFQHEKFGFSIRYEVKNNQIIMTKQMYCNTLFIKHKDFELWNEMVKTLDIAYRNSIKLSISK